MPGPITSVPNEILILIFHHYIKMGGVVWDLMPVTKHWERIAFGTGSLWTSILIQTRSVRDNSFKEFVYNDDKEYYKWTKGPFTDESKSQHVCFEPHHLSKAISRTGECLLDIEISFRAQYVLNRSSLNSLIETLMEPAVSARIRSLDLYIDLLVSPILGTKHFNRVSLHNLLQLKIRSAPKIWTRNLLRSISANTRKLEVMHCNTAEPIDRYLSDRILNEIRVFRHEWPNISEGFDALIHKLANVEDIASFPLNWPSNITPQATFLHLRKASLNCHPFHIRRIQWPSLETLSVGEYGVSGASIGPRGVNLDGSKEELPQVSFPMLKSFAIKSGHPSHWLSNVSAPQLRTLSIKWEHYSNVEPPKDLLLGPFPSVKWILSHTPFDDEEIIPILKLLPNVTEVDIFPESTKWDFGLGFLKSLIETENDSSLCPKLSKLTLGSSSHQVHTQKFELEPEIERLIQMGKRPITSLRVFWSTGGGYQQYASISRTY